MRLILASALAFDIATSVTYLNDSLQNNDDL